MDEADWPPRGIRCMKAVHSLGTSVDAERRGACGRSSAVLEAKVKGRREQEAKALLME